LGLRRACCAAPRRPLAALRQPAPRCAAVARAPRPLRSPLASLSWADPLVRVFEKQAPAAGALGAEEALSALLKRDTSISSVLGTLTSAVKGLSKARGARPDTAAAAPRAARPLPPPALTRDLSRWAAQVVEEEHCATAESVSQLDGKLSALLALLAQPAPAAAADPTADCAEAEADALRDALADAEVEAASLQRGNDALQAALESATALLGTARAEAAAMRHAVSAAEEAVAEELQVRAVAQAQSAAATPCDPKAAALPNRLASDEAFARARRRTAPRPLPSRRPPRCAPRRSSWRRR